MKVEPEPTGRNRGRWWRTDFHTHSPASHDTHMEGVSEAAWLLAFMHARVDIIAVTDHNTGIWIDQIKKTYNQMEQESCPDFRPLTIFPGVEITTEEGLHLLAIFDPQYGTEKIESLLGDIGSPMTNRGDASCYAGKNGVDIILCIKRNNGIAIPAHIDRKRGKGIFSLDRDRLSHLILSGGISVVESSGLSSEWPLPYQNNPHGWAIITGSDTHTLNPEDPISRIPGSIVTRIFMKEPTLDALRIVFQSGNELVCREVPDSPPE